jgi:hypothetical protein
MADNSDDSAHGWNSWLTLSIPMEHRYTRTAKHPFMPALKVNSQFPGIFGLIRRGPIAYSQRARNVRPLRELVRIAGRRISSSAARSQLAKNGVYDALPPLPISAPT